MKSLMRKLPWIAIAAAIVGLLVWSFLPAPVEVDLGRVERGPLRVTIDHEGKTRVRERYTVSSPLAGRLLRLDLHAGDPAAAGKTLLAVIEPNEPALLDARAVAQSEARVRAAEAARERAAPQLRAAQASYALAETALGRARKLSKQGAVAHQELDDAEHRLRVCTEDVKAAEFAGRIAQFELELARAALLHARPSPGSEPQSSRFEIRAPISGRILRVFQESEGAITAGTRLVELGDLNDLEVEVDVLSTDAVKIRPGARATLEHWGGDAPLEGRVRLVEPSAFTKVSALGVEEQRVNVLIDLTGPVEGRQTLGDAFRVEARIVVWEAARVLKLPAGALFRQGSAWTVFRLERGRAAARRVSIGHTNGLETEVLAGLNAGDRVVMHPSDRVVDGAAIAPR